MNTLTMSRPDIVAHARQKVRELLEAGRNLFPQANFPQQWEVLARSACHVTLDHFARVGAELDYWPTPRAG